VTTASATALVPRLSTAADDEKYGLSRHWSNTRLPVNRHRADWKYHHAGNHLLNSVAPPNHGQI
jgi:hypothetical protein